MELFRSAFHHVVKRIFKKGSKTYYYSSLFFPREVRDDVSVFYAYVRTADDFVDSIPQDTAGFKQFRKETELAIQKGSSSDQIIQGLVTLVQKHDIKPEWIFAFLDAMEADTRKAEYKTIQELEEYMYGSAEVIGLVMARILNLPEESYQAARLQGRAMQLINFIRDVEEDNRLKRQYLPTEDMKIHRLKSLTHPVNGTTPHFNEFVRFQIKRYRELQKEAEKGYKYIPKKYLIPVKTAADMYNWTAEQIEKNPTVVFEKKVKPKPYYIILSALKNVYTL